MGFLDNVFGIIEAFDHASELYKKVTEAGAEAAPPAPPRPPVPPPQIPQQKRSQQNRGPKKVEQPVDEPPQGARPQASTPRIPKPKPLAREYQILGVVPGAPKFLVDAAYKAAAREYHPDRGGDAKKMSEINQAYESIKAERGWA